MRKQRPAAVLLCAALLLCLPGCGRNGEGPASGAASSQAPSSGISAQDQAGTPADIPFALAVYPDYSLHPVLAENRANLTLAPLLYEPLFQVDETFQAVPVLCRSHAVSGDKLSWTFTLRAGVTFSDGTALSGQAVADALELARREGSRYAQRLRDVTAVTAGEGSVTLTLSRPNDSLPLLLDIPIALGDGNRPLGTGPYVLEDGASSLTLAARPDWWQDKALPAPSIPLVTVSRSDDLIAGFSSGDVGLVDVDLMGTNALGYSGSYETWDYATTDFLYLGFNTQSGLCRSAPVRRALARAVDRESIVQTDYARHAAAAALPVHPDSSLYSQAQAGQLDYNPELLVSQLEEQRVLGRSLVLLVNSENTAKAAAARRIAGQLEGAGMSVELRTLDFERYAAALAAGDFDLYLGEVVLTADFDLSPLLAPGGALNYGQWQDEQISALLSDLRRPAQGSRADAAQRLFDHLNEQVPIVPICFKNGSVLTQWGRLSGLSPVRGNIFYRLENWSIG